MAKTLTAHEAALAALVPPERRDAFDRGVQALVARNLLVEVVEVERKAQNLTKKEVAERAGLDPASVRRLLTTEGSNPTQETAIRLLAALGIHLRADLPSGRSVGIV